MDTKRLILLATLLMSLFPAHAGAEDCYLWENDPQTRRMYQSRAHWENDLKKLQDKTPPSPGIFALLEGYEVFKAESAKSRGIGSDKRRHCYVGCRIAQKSGFEVAVFAGYYKEDQDLRDCSPRTQFDWEDIDATVLGADLARKNPADKSPKFCWDRCRQSFRR